MAQAAPAGAGGGSSSGTGGAHVVSNTLHVLQAKVVTLTPAPVKQAAGRARAAFRAKPWASTATALAFASWCLTLIAFFVRWMSFSNGAGVTGYITLTEVSNCLEQSASPYTPAYECGVYQLLNNAPTAMKWIYSAGAASLSFLIFAFVASTLATWLTYLRRINSLHTLPGFMHSLHGENIMTTIYAQAATTFCLMLAFAIWAGQFNANFLNVETLKCFGMADTSSGVIIGSPAYSFNGGFAIVIIAWLLSPLSAGILFWKQNEVEHVDPAEAAAAGGGGGSDAVQDAFPSAGAPPLPPGTVPYGGGGGGGAPYAGGAGSGPYGGGGGVPYAPPGVPAYDNVT